MPILRVTPATTLSCAGARRWLPQLLVAAGLLVWLAACEAPATDAAGQDVQAQGNTDVAVAATDVLVQTDVGTDVEPGTDAGLDVEPDASADLDTGSGTDAVPGTDAAIALDVETDISGPDSTDTADSGATDGAVGTDAIVVPACSKNSDCPQTPGGCVAAICAAGQCLPQLLPEGSACSDGNPCTANAACKGGACTALGSVACDDGQPCTADSCDTASGLCVHTPANAGSACDDGDACTQGTLCDAAGVCTGGKNACGCKSIKDCAPAEDGNPCNGTLYCNDTLPVPVCQVLPGSVVTCDGSNDTTCSRNQCNPSSGQCAITAVTDGTPCDDGSSCSTEENCLAGTCQAKVNLCQCQTASDCAGKEDGNKCNGTLYCDKSGPLFACKVNPASVVQCPKPANVCQVAACDAASGACITANAADGTACSDGNAATVGDSCQAGTCTPGAVTAECNADSDCAGKEDGNFCNGVLFCNKAEQKCQLNPKTIVTCPTVDDTTCAQNQCVPSTGLCQLKTATDGTLCEDGNKCTVGDVCVQGQCQASADTCLCKSDSDCNAQDDGNLCNGKLYCDLQTNQCVLNPATVVYCSPAANSDCAQNQCDPKVGTCAMVPTLDGSACDDDNSCTEGEACIHGDCVGTQICACLTDTDCEDDGDLCNGTLYCDKKAGQCAVNPATVKKCPTAADTACAKNVCQPDTGACEMVAQFTGAACEADGNPCTKSDYCADGACIAGNNVCGCLTDAECAGKQGADQCVLSMYCNKDTFTCQPAQSVQCDKSEDTPCSKTACNPKTGSCEQRVAADGILCGEGGLCAGVLICQDGACLAGPAVDCSDADPCTLDSCDIKQGCQYTALTASAEAPAPCDDGNVCTSSDACNLGNCVGTAKDCSDASPCTADACDPKLGCVYLPLAATACDDDNACTVADSCKDGLCKPGSEALPCSDGLQCTLDACDPQQGCVFTAVSAKPCDDGSACTKSDQCVQGQCQGAVVDCDDEAPCTKDSCDLVVGCQNLPLTGTACTDDNACTGPDTCSKQGTCKPGPAFLCFDGNPCTLDQCNPASGCENPSVVGGQCDDGDGCTGNDKCLGGACQGSPVVCDDYNPCTIDSCAGEGTCVFTANQGLACNDNNACTGDDACTEQGACQGVPSVQCGTDTQCIDYGCNAAGGCVSVTLDGKACTDSNPCTSVDKCEGSACLGTAIFCDDGNPCTLDGCDVATGNCTAVGSATLDGIVCNDGNFCTTTDVCDGQGTCKGSGLLACNDNNACTDDLCTPGVGCTFASNAATCNDGNACTLGDKCAGGICAYTSVVGCDDNNPCTADSCNTTTGQCTSQGTALLAGIVCNDSNICTPSDTCNALGSCVGAGALNCNDNNSCTNDTCGPTSGCLYAPNNASCSDNNACTLGDQCTGGTCFYTGTVACDDGKPCTLDACDPVSGACSNVGSASLSGVLCSDGSLCTPTDTCNSSGGCVGSGSLTCNDNNVCTDDSCTATGGCVYVIDNNNVCSDDNACTLTDKCVGGACTFASQKNCSDNNPCTLDNCNVNNGNCNNPGNASLNGASCTDGSLCTPTDACDSNGACIGSGSLSCSDGLPCTDDTCSAGSGCVFAPDDTNTCNDGNACTLNDKCVGGSCSYTSNKNCADTNPCTLDSCNTTTGACSNVGSATLIGSSCTDGNICTPTDACTGSGTCAGSGGLVCNDNIDCTDDSCNPTAGCVATPDNSNTCSDGLLCTTPDTCTAGACTGAAVSCNDNKVCTLDSCNSSTGACVFNAAAMNNAACSDGDACTLGDKCNGVAATCQAGGVVATCDDGNVCTTDSCVPASGCSNQLNTANCDDGNVCTSGEKCASGTCSGGVPKDADGDGYVDKNCTTTNKDCDDSVATIKPGGSEICDNVDQDCDAVTDEGCDDDDDGFCDSAMTTSSGIVVVTCLGGGNDCNDVDPLINPAAQESLEPTRNGPWTSNASTGGTIVRAKIKGNRAWALLNFTDGFAAGAPRAVLATKLNGDANWVFLLPPITADDTSLNDLAITDTAVHVVGARTVYGTGGNEYSYMMHWTSPITGAYQLRNWTATMQPDIQVGSTLRLVAGADNVVHVLGQNKYGRLATNGTWTFTTIGTTTNADLDTASDSSVHIALTQDDGIYYSTDKGNLGTLTTTQVVSGSGLASPQLALSGGDAVHLVYWKYLSGDGWSLEHTRKLPSGNFAWIATLGSGQPSPADTAIAPRNNGMDLYSPAVGFRTNLDASAVWTVIGAYNGGPVAPMAYLPRSFTGGTARLLGFDGQDAKEWTMAEGGPPTKTLMMPYFSGVRATARQTVGMGGTLAVQTLGGNLSDPVLVPGLTRTVWFGDTLTQITSNLGVDKPVDDVANSLINNASFVSVNAGESFYLWPNAGTVNPYPSDGLAYGFNPSSNLDTYVIPLQDGRFVVSGPKGNGDIQFVMWTPANWATYAAGGASVYQYQYVGLPIGYGTAMAGCTGADAAKALTFQCGPSGLRLIPFNTVANGHGYLEGDQVLNMAAGDCSRVWARYDTTDSSHHVFAVISGKLNYFKDVTDGSSWTQTVVSTAVVTNSAIAVSSSLRGNPLVQVDGTLYDRRDGTWAATQLVVSTWFPAISTSPWQMSGFDDGDSRWGVMGSASFLNPTPMVHREEWFQFQPTNAIDQNCNGL